MMCVRTFSTKIFFLIQIVLVYTTPLKVTGRIDGKIVVFDCPFEEKVTTENAIFIKSRKDQLCKSFQSDLEKMISVDLYIILSEKKDVEVLKAFATKHGSKIRTLRWVPFEDSSPTTHELLQLLKNVPNLRRFELNEWKTPLTFDERRYQILSELKVLEIDDCDLSSLLDFFTKYLPRDVLHELILKTVRDDSPQAMAKFISMQRNIKVLKIQGYLTTFEPFKHLGLTNFACSFSGSIHEEQKIFIRELLMTQPQLVELDLIGSDYQYEFLDDNMFDEVCKLEQLTDLKFNIDGISHRAVDKISSLRKLKNLNVKTNLKDSVLKLNHLSMVNKPDLGNLDLSLWVSLPEQTYIQLNRNYPDLKSLAVKLGVKHTLNFFMRTFPNLESLSVYFGDGNNGATFGASYVDDEFKHENIKDLRLTVVGFEDIDINLFIKMRNSFPNLESLEVQATLPFTEVFLKEVLNSLGKIKRLTISTLLVRCNDEFSNEMVQILKDLQSKLDLVSLNLSIRVGTSKSFKCLFFTDRMIEGQLYTSKANLDFTPLLVPLKDDYFIDQHGYANIRVTENVNLRGGKKIESVK